MYSSRAPCIVIPPETALWSWPRVYQQWHATHSGKWRCTSSLVSPRQISIYSRLPHNPYPSVDCPGYGVSGSMGFKKWPNKGQTNKILCKNPEESQKTDTLLLTIPKSSMVRPESLIEGWMSLFVTAAMDQWWIKTSPDLWLGWETTILPLLITFYV